MEATLDSIHKKVLELEKSSLEQASAELTKQYGEKHFIYTRYRHHAKSYKYGGIVKKVEYNRVANRSSIYYSFGLEYLNKKGELKTMRLKFDSWNNVEFFDSAEDAKLFLEVTQ